MYSNGAEVSSTKNVTFIQFLTRLRNGETGEEKIMPGPLVILDNSCVEQLSVLLAHAAHASKQEGEKSCGLIS